MARPLRKSKLDGTLYTRRPEVEAELQALATLSAVDLGRRASINDSRSTEYVSPEALLHFVRTLAEGPIRERLTAELLHRVVLLTPRVGAAGGHTVSLTDTNIRDDMVDHVIDLLVSDWAGYEERLDFLEVNFNLAMKMNRVDASDRHWKRENRSEELGDDETDVSEVVEAAIGSYNPFGQDEIDKKDYRRRLDAAIDSLPEFQRRIVEMWRQEVPIESKDPSIMSMCKVLGKTEKTIRTHRDKAFASLRLRLENKGNL